jgi:hypothetical protein
VDAPPNLRLTITDVRRSYCVRGAKSWFDGHGLDFRGFLKNGILAGDLPDDAFANRVIATSLGRADGRR